MLARPSTAPGGSRSSAPERWTEVDMLVRDMLSSVAVTACSADALPRRPHTACACPQTVPVATFAASQSTIIEADDEEDSDGASFDEEEIPRSVASAPVQSEVLILEAEPERSARAARATLPQQIILPRGQMLLLSGELWRRGRAEDSGGSNGPGSAVPLDVASTSQASSARNSLLPAPANAVAKTKAPSATLPETSVKKLPKQCVFVGTPSASSKAGRSLASGGRLTPSAARMRSHASWTSFLPTRPASGASAVLNAKQKSDLHSVPEVGDPSQADKVGNAVVVAAPATIASNTGQAAAEAGEHATEVGINANPNNACDEVKRKRGPKYQVRPGCSRPAASSSKRLAGSPAGTELLVLEFRTEPRVVPASRLSLKEPVPGVRNGVQDKGKGGRTRLRFRPDSRGTWAKEREALSSR